MSGDLPAILIVCAAILAACSGLPLLFRLGSANFGQRLATAGILVAAAAGICGAMTTLLTSTRIIWSLSWPFPFGPATIGVDPLTAFFALPILLVAACCSIYALDYWPANDHPRTIRKLTFFFGLLVASMLLTTMARSTGIFLLSWEVMALAAYFILTTDDHTPSVRDAGTVYMICTHTGTLVLFAFFALLQAASGSYIFPAAATLAANSPLATTLFLLALFGFGFKAGIMPFHIWLPAAHANAPSHVSAIMSGVILKIGIYGIVRSLSFFSALPLWWGIVLLVLGMLSGVIGVLFALGQHDLKRLLAYHSIENIGIIVMGLGVAVIGISSGSRLLMLLGLAGALLHVLNHATFKALLFLGAGSIIHSVGTREIDRMGGLLRRLPWTSVSFLTGAVAICGLPPLNGFVSELLIYLGFFNGVIIQEGAAAFSSALAAPALALIGGLAIACFVKVFGVIFLGAPRSAAAEHPHEAGWSMRIPMLLLALVCFAIGLFPLLIAPLLTTAVASFFPANAPSLPALESQAPLGALTLVGFGLLLITVGVTLWYRRRLRATTVASGPTWGCGYLAPTARMQYTASSFADLLINLTAGILRPDRHPPTIESPFPTPQRFSSHLPETVLEQIYIPLLSWGYRKALPIRHLQHGHLHLYILYTFITLVVLLLISL